MARIVLVMATVLVMFMFMMVMMMIMVMVMVIVQAQVKAQESALLKVLAQVLTVMRALPLLMHLMPPARAQPRSPQAPCQQRVRVRVRGRAARRPPGAE